MIVTCQSELPPSAKIWLVSNFLWFNFFDSAPSKKRTRREKRSRYSWKIMSFLSVMLYFWQKYMSFCLYFFANSVFSTRKFAYQKKLHQYFKSKRMWINRQKKDYNIQKMNFFKKSQISEKYMDGVISNDNICKSTVSLKLLIKWPYKTQTASQIPLSFSLPGVSSTYSRLLVLFAFLQDPRWSETEKTTPFGVKMDVLLHNMPKNPL